MPSRKQKPRVANTPSTLMKTGKLSNSRKREKKAQRHVGVEDVVEPLRDVRRACHHVVRRKKYAIQVPKEDGFFAVLGRRAFDDDDVLARVDVGAAPLVPDVVVDANFIFSWPGPASLSLASFIVVVVVGSRDDVGGGAEGEENAAVHDAEVLGMAFVPVQAACPCRARREGDGREVGLGEVVDYGVRGVALDLGVFEREGACHD